MYVVYTSVHDVQAWDCDMDFTLYIVVQTLLSHAEKESGETRIQFWFSMMWCDVRTLYYHFSCQKFY